MNLDHTFLWTHSPFVVASARWRLLTQFQQAGVSGTLGFVAC